MVQIFNVVANPTAQWQVLLRACFRFRRGLAVSAKPGDDADVG